MNNLVEIVILFKRLLEKKTQITIQKETMAMTPKDQTTKQHN
jgi:hypothetical protein